MEFEKETVWVEVGRAQYNTIVMRQLIKIEQKVKEKVVQNRLKELRGNCLKLEIYAGNSQIVYIIYLKDRRERKCALY